MKVFIAWSGDVSHQVARVLRDWLPKVIQRVKPFISSEDIEKGSHWAETIGKELEDTSFGILCLTQTNVAAPWVHFEAGALSKMTEQARVCPFLFRVQGSEVKGPLGLFQSTSFDKDDVRKLLDTLNKREAEESQLGEVHLQQAFEMWWPKLEERLTGIVVPDAPTPSDDGETRDAAAERAILEEILELTRSQQRVLSNREELHLVRLFEQTLQVLTSQSKALDRLGDAATPLGRGGQPLGKWRPAVQYLDELTSARSGPQVLSEPAPVVPPPGVLLGRGSLLRGGKTEPPPSDEKPDE